MNRKILAAIPVSYTHLEALELVASETSTLFFNLATAQTNLDIATYNYASADTLYRYAEGDVYKRQPCNRPLLLFRHAAMIPRCY